MLCSVLRITHKTHLKVRPSQVGCRSSDLPSTLTLPKSTPGLAASDIPWRTSQKNVTLPTWLDPIDRFPEIITKSERGGQVEQVSWIASSSVRHVVKLSVCVDRYWPVYSGVPSKE